MPKATRLRLRIKFAVLILLPIVLYVIPTEGIYNGESLCIFKQCFGIECWGCGITRAFFSVLYGDFVQAWDYNPGIAILFPLLLWLWIKEIRQTTNKLKSGRN